MEAIIQKCLPTYQVVDKLGEGVYGSVFRIRDRFKERAVKVVPIMVDRSLSHRSAEALDSKISGDFHSVRAYYEAIKGRGVIDVYDFHLVDKQVTRQGARAHLVILMEFYPENLQDHVLDHFPVDADRADRMMGELAGTLERLSRPGENAFLVTDLKPSNLLLNRDRHLLIGDLGGVKRISSVSTMAGSQFSPSWCAPEIVLKGERPRMPSAVYAYGLVAYFMWEGHLPYDDADFSHRPGLIREKGLTFDHPHVPGPLQGLIEGCLAFDPALRPKDFAEIVQWLQKAVRTVPRRPAPAAVGTDPGRHTRTYGDRETQTVQRPGSADRSQPPASGELWTDPLVHMAFVRVVGGHFNMGGLPDDHLAETNEKPAHGVAIADFWIGRYPVTQLQWQTVMGSNPSHFQKGEMFPVEQVSWNDAMAFVKRMGAMHDGKYSFGLPTEVQWEYAARSGGTDEVYAGGSDLGQIGWYRDNSDYATHPVGEKQPNGLGIFDMSGNVLEWCADVYAAAAYRHQPPADVGSSESRINRVCRGGSWTHAAHRCRTTARRGVPGGLRYTSLGFRLVRLQ